MSVLSGRTEEPTRFCFVSFLLFGSFRFFFKFNFFFRLPTADRLFFEWPAVHTWEYHDYARTSDPWRTRSLVSRNTAAAAARLRVPR